MGRYRWSATAITILAGLLPGGLPQYPGALGP